ncbi:ABC1 kinase family protein [Haliea sp. E17]|uniref:ABC1 kinase family protein n=1 Tax=Haliea sp. E17 TaxID=3401576 RepID=UPI003AB023A4
MAVSLAGLRAGGALALDGAVGRVLGREEGDSEFARREARRFVAELGRLKGTYVKIGQMMALFGEHFLPAVLVEALRELSDGTEPMAWSELEPFVRESLGARYDELDIDPQAVAAASLAQVHLARLRDGGEWICLKIQYPGLRELIEADFDAVIRMLVLSRWVKSGRDLDNWMHSLREHLLLEIDYRREARVTTQMRERVSTLRVDSVHYHVPELFPRYCSGEVLAMEFIEGYPVTAKEVSGLSQARRDALGRAMLELFFYELYDWGLLQTDPNFGNYLLRLDDRRKSEADDELALLDFGSVLDCPEDFLLHLRRTVAASQQQDMHAIVEGLTGLGCLQPDASAEGREMFADFCLHLLEPLRPADQLPAEYLNAQGEYCWARSHLMRRAGKKAAASAASRHFTPPSREFALIARKLTGVFNFIAALDAQFNGCDVLERHVAAWQEREIPAG